MERTSSFGYWLRRRRKALDLTQAELAQRVSCSLELIQKIEADARRPSRQLAEKLAECLGIAADERAAFVQAARAERSADRLALPSQPVEQPVAALPQGTITFLFTDIEGSSRLWEQHPRAMPSALARHDALLNEIVTAHGGVVFKTVGDSVLAAFAQAPDALAARLLAADDHINNPLQYFGTDSRREWEGIAAAAHAQLDETTWAAAWAEGRTMSLEQAIADALGEVTE